VALDVNSDAHELKHHHMCTFLPPFRWTCKCTWNQSETHLDLLYLSSLWTIQQAPSWSRWSSWCSQRSMVIDICIKSWWSHWFMW